MSARQRSENVAKKSRGIGSVSSQVRLLPFLADAERNGSILSRMAVLCR